MYLVICQIFILVFISFVSYNSCCRCFLYVISFAMRCVPWRITYPFGFGVGTKCFGFISLLSLSSHSNILKYLGNEFRWGPKMSILVSISHILITVNCSSNFAIYCSKVRIYSYCPRGLASWNLICPWLYVYCVG